MKPSNVLRYAAQFTISLVVFLALFISGCGGGGGGGGSPPPNDPNRVGKGWITITGSSAGTTNSTSAPSVILSGDAFISPTWWHCCSGSGSDTGVTVSWTNTTTGVSGAARQTPQYCSLFSPPFLCGHKWDTMIDLVMGNNVITITATDPSDNLGRVTTTVTRTPDVTPPTIRSTSPSNGASAVGTNASFTVIFDEQMDPASISAATILLKDNLSNSVSGSVTYSNLVATFIPVTTLLQSTKYTATVTTGVKDIAGNALATAYVWSFTTGPFPDTTPPTVTSTSPSNGATCVPAETQILATFSKVLQGQTVNANTFLLRDSQNNLVSGMVAYDYLGQAAFSQNSTLANSSNYTGTLTTGLMDLAGNHLAADYTWTFTTQAAGTGMWNPITTALAPLPRYRHTAVWTGSEMIVWGGEYGFSVLGDGARYNPATDSWIPISTVGAPSARYDHVAVWTGSKMIVWGGVQPGAFLASGAIYDPSTDSWTSIPSSGAPSARQHPTAVWTGTEMIIWGGFDGTNPLNSGARYNPSTNSWSTLSAVGAPSARSGHTSIWSGSAMLVWGGSGLGSVLMTGGIYTPSSNSWTAIPTTSAPAARQSHSSVWTGTEMIIWGGWDGKNPLDSGARYNPSTNSWQSIASACAPLARYGHIAVWSGTDMIVWGGSSFYRAGGRYSPNTDTWQAIPVVGMPSARTSHTGFWTGADLILWGGIDSSASELNSGGRYRPQ